MRCELFKTHNLLGQCCYGWRSISNNKIKKIAMHTVLEPNKYKTNVTHSNGEEATRVESVCRPASVNRDSLWNFTFVQILTSKKIKRLSCCSFKCSTAFVDYRDKRRNSWVLALDAFR